MLSEIILASKNHKKAKELKNMLGNSVGLIRNLDKDYPDVEENGSSFFENAMIKAKAAYARYKVPVLADDSGLQCDALKGEPGIRSARFAGDEQDDEKNINKLLESLNGLEGSQRSANFITSIVLILSSKYYASFEGLVYGRLSSTRLGDGGFGYDPIFVPNGYELSFAQMSADEKNSISHRSAALNKLKAFLRHLNADG